jgi:hypothetical protein
MFEASACNMSILTAPACEGYGGAAENRSRWLGGEQIFVGRSAIAFERQQG